MAAKLSPLFNDQTLTASNTFASGYKLFTYAAGSSTKQSTFTDSAGLVPQSNPILLNASGQPTNGPIWLAAGSTYKFVLALPTDTDPPTSPVKTFDNIIGVGDTGAVTTSQWQPSGLTPTYVSTTSFTVPGDQTIELHVGRRVQFTTTAGTVYGIIATTAFAALTTVTMLMEGSGVLDSGLSVVNLSILRNDHPAMPSLYGAGTIVSNLALGDTALDSNTTGVNNTAFGFNALTANTTGGANIAVGRSALLVNDSGSNNTAVGLQALFSNVSGSNNTAIGVNAHVQGTGSSNTAVGASALGGAGNTATSNTAVGFNAGTNLTTGGNNTVLGANATASAAGVNNEFTLGSGIATLRCAVTSITSTSDERDKKEIQDIGLGIDFVNQLRPVKFKWAMRDGTERPDIFEPGFIAQDFKRLQDSENVPWMGLVYDSNQDRLEATPGRLIPVLVKAIQDLSDELSTLRQKLNL